jgi:hypothetical protein
LQQHAPRPGEQFAGRMLICTRAWLLASLSSGTEMPYQARPSTE